MTVSKKHVEGVHFALIPHKCDECCRVFWFEDYAMEKSYFRFLGSIDLNYCQHCRTIQKENDMEEEDG